MKLYELYEYIDDCQMISVTNAENGECYDTFDGKNSIDEKYNECEIRKIYAHNNCICISVEPMVKQILVRATITYTGEFTMEVNGFADRWEIDDLAEEKLDEIIYRAYIEADEGDWELDCSEVTDWEENNGY